MRELSKYLLLLSLLSGLIVNAPATVEARGGGGFHGGGDTMIFIPPSGGGGANSPGLHYGGANQIGNRGGSFDIEKRGGGHSIGDDGNIRQRDVSGKYKGNASRSDSYMRHRVNDGSIGRSKRSGTRHLSRSDFEASRKHQNLGVKKRPGHYKGGGKSRTVHHDPARHNHKRRHSRYGTYRYYYYGWWYSEPWWTDTYYDDRVTCLEAQQMIQQHYGSVTMVECVGRIYTFRAKNAKGKSVELRVDSLTGTYWQS